MGGNASGSSRNSHNNNNSSSSSQTSIQPGKDIKKLGKLIYNHICYSIESIYICLFIDTTIENQVHIYIIYIHIIYII